MQCNWYKGPMCNKHCNLRIKTNFGRILNDFHSVSLVQKLINKGKSSFAFKYILNAYNYCVHLLEDVIKIYDFCAL